MRKNLVNEQQPFGQKMNAPMHSSTLANAAPHFNRPGSTTSVGNNGNTRVESFADKNPGAYEQACRGRDNPFGPVGKDFGVGIRNQAEVYTNAN